MIVTITLAGTDITNLVNEDSLDVESVLTKQIDSCKFTIEGKPTISGTARAPAEKVDEVVITDENAVRIFAGYVSKVTPDVSGLTPTSGVTVKDYTELLDGVLVNEVFENKNDSEIATALFAEYLPEITVQSAVNGLTHTRIVFNRISLREVIDYIHELSGNDWRIDYDKKYYSFDQQIEAAPFNVSDSPDFTTSYPYQDFKFNKNADKIVNKVTVVGGTYNSDDTDFELPNNGQTTELLLPYKLHAPDGETGILVYKNTGSDATPVWTAQTVGVDYIDTLADHNVLYNFEEKLLRFATAPANLKRAVKIHGKYEVPVLIRVKSQDSYDTFGRWYEEKIVDKQIDSIDWAKQRGYGYLLENAFAKQSGSFTCFYDGLKAGQRITITNAPREVADTFIITKVVASIVGGTQWRYRVTFGVLSKDLVDVLIDLKRKTQKLQLDQNAQEIEILNEILDQNETVTLSESTDLHNDATPANRWIALPPTQAAGCNVEHNKTNLSDEPALTSNAKGAYTWDNFKWDFMTWG